MGKLIFLAKIGAFLIAPLLAVFFGYNAFNFRDKVIILETKNKSLEAEKKSIFEDKNKNIDSLQKIIENQKENANVVNLSFDKTKLKGSGNIIIDTKQLQSIACDTLQIVSFWESLKPRERKAFRESKKNK
jgi:hypothetical protein